MFPLFIYCTLPGALSCCYLWFKALFSLHDMSFFHHYVYDTGVCCLHVDEQVHMHDTIQDGVQRHKEGMALHQCDESVTCLAAPLVSKDDGLGWRMHSNNLELMSLIQKQNICLFLFVQFHFEKTNVYKFYDKCVLSNITTWKGWDRRSEGSSLRLLLATTAVFPKSKKNTCKTLAIYSY